MLDAELERRGVRPVEKPWGHPRTTSLLVLSALSGGPLAAGDVAKRTGQGIHAVQQMLSKLFKCGEIRRVERGLYALPERQ